MNAHIATLPRGRATRFDAWIQRHPHWWTAAFAFAVLAVAFAALAFFDDRTFNGVSVWVKPFKFALSIAVYFGTLAWYAPLMPNGYFEARRGRRLIALPIVCAALEIAYIAIQADRVQASHFNQTSPFYAAMYALMGVGAFALIGVCAWIGWVVLRERGTRDPYAFAVAIGLFMTVLLGGGFGTYMAEHLSHWVGGTPSDAGGWGFFKWSRDGGDLRVAHFFGMHAMQVVPVIGAAATRLTSRGRAIVIVVLAACAYAALTTFTFIQALQGRPFV